MNGSHTLAFCENFLREHLFCETLPHPSNGHSLCVPSFSLEISLVHFLGITLTSAKQCLLGWQCYSKLHKIAPWHLRPSHKLNYIFLCKMCLNRILMKRKYRKTCKQLGFKISKIETNLN